MKLLLLLILAMTNLAATARPVAKLFFTVPSTQPSGYEWLEPAVKPENRRAWMLNRRDGCVATAREAGADVVLCWDLPTGPQYTGAPEMSRAFNAEVDGWLDGFFGNFPNDIRPGLTISSTEWYQQDGRWRSRGPLSEWESARRINQRIAYAHARWGIKHFYIDISSHFADPVTQEAGWWKPLAFERYKLPPGVEVYPEHHDIDIHGKPGFRPYYQQPPSDGGLRFQDAKGPSLVNFYGGGHTHRDMPLCREALLAGHKLAFDGPHMGSGALLIKHTRELIEAEQQQQNAAERLDAARKRLVAALP
jgi:hypothetical protein